jgi:hypothetical protein
MLHVTLIAAISTLACIGFWARSRKLARQIHTLEQNLQEVSEMVSQMAETQMKGYQKQSARIEEMEERLMELSVPHHNSSMPLERRHKVLALARQGVALEDIVKRLKAPVGETEMIINLHKYTIGAGSRSKGMNNQVKNYA